MKSKSSAGVLYWSQTTVYVAALVRLLFLKYLTFGSANISIHLKVLIKVKYSWQIKLIVQVVEFHLIRAILTLGAVL